MNQIALNDVLAHIANPHPFSPCVQEEGPPLACINWAGQEMWGVTRYEDTIAILKNPRFILDTLNTHR